MPALELGGITLGVREGVIVLITLVAIYMVFVLLRMYFLRSKPVAAVPPVPEPAVADVPVLNEIEVPSAPFAEMPAQSGDAWEVTAQGGLAESMQQLGLVQQLAQDVAQLRDEVDSIRGELAALRQDLQQEVAHLHSAQAVSPVYGDAMQMAAAGYDPIMIADRCGIARAEAELVVALAKSQMQ